MTAPWPTASFVTVALGTLALFMFAGNLYVVRRLFPGRVARPHLGDVVLISGLLLTAVFLWLSLIYVAISPTVGAWIGVLLAINSMMVAVSAWFIAVMLRAEERVVSATGWRWPAMFTGLVLANELTMAVAFVLIQAGPATYPTTEGVGVIALLADATTSIWFFWPMLGSMALLVATVPLGRGERRALGGLTASAAVGPWVVAAPLLGAITMALLMAVVFAILFRELHRDMTTEYLAVARGVIGAYAVMGAAEAAFYFDPSSPWAPVPFAAATIGVMGAEVLYLGRFAMARLPDPPRIPRVPSPYESSGTSLPEPTEVASANRPPAGVEALTSHPPPR